MFLSSLSFFLNVSECCRSFRLRCIILRSLCAWPIFLGLRRENDGVFGCAAPELPVLDMLILARKEDNCEGRVLYLRMLGLGMGVSDGMIWKGWEGV